MFIVYTKVRWNNIICTIIIRNSSIKSIPQDFPRDFILGKIFLQAAGNPLIDCVTYLTVPASSWRPLDWLLDLHDCGCQQLAIPWLNAWLTWLWLQAASNPLIDSFTDLTVAASSWRPLDWLLELLDRGCKQLATPWLIAWLTWLWLNAAGNPLIDCLTYLTVTASS